MNIDQREFEKTIEEFHKLEDARDQLWDRAQVLIEKGFEIEAYILILATWNFAGFRYVMKDFDLKEFDKVIKDVNPYFIRIKNKKFEDIDFSDDSLISDIKSIYTQLKKIAKQTGASKLMALKNSNLFIMWDTEIREMNDINIKTTPDDYIEFLKKMKDKFKKIKWHDKKRSFAKVIDEYNYTKADKRRKARADEKK